MTPTRIVSYDTAPPSTSTARAGHGNAVAMQSLENDTTVSHPSHSALGDADSAGVSHIPVATTTGSCFFQFKRKSARVGDGTPTPHSLKEEQP